MYLLLFVVTLVFHVAICLLYFRTIATPVGIYGLIWFTLLTLTQLPIIEYNELSVLAIALFYIAYFFFLIPSLFSSKKSYECMLRELEDVNVSALRKIAYITLIIYTFVALIAMIYIVKYFGGLSKIFDSPYSTREEYMNADIIPLIVSYSLSLSYIPAGIFSYLLFFTKTKVFDKLLYLSPLLVVACLDLMSFSRMNTIFHIIIYFSSFCLRLTKMKRIERRKYLRIIISSAIIVVIVLVVPKLFRNHGDYSTDTYWKYSYIDNINPITGSFLHLFTYATGPIVAFSEFVTNFKGDFLFGQASFLPIYNLLARVLPFVKTDFSILYKSVYVPFPINIFTFLREAYTDFGIFGVMGVPIIWGLLCNLCLKVRLKNNFLKIVILQYVYLYLIFGIFYTPYSQGSPAFGMFLYFFTVLFLGKKLNRKALYRSANK